MKVQRLSSIDGFIVWDLDAATTSVGVVRLAPKVLQDGAVLLARTVTYAFASFGVPGHGGASAALSAKAEQRDTTLTAFVEEVRHHAEERRLRLSAGLGVADEDLAPLGWTGPDVGLIATGAVAAARVAAAAVGLDGLSGRRVAIVGSGPVAEAAATAVTESADARLVDARFDAEADVLFVAGKPGCLDHDTAETVRARVIVPLTLVPVTARALAVLGRADRVVVPDFLSTAASLLATHDPAGGDVDIRIADAVGRVADAGTGMWLAATRRAEEYLTSWTGEKPFGRPLA